jgi:excisionase family DNA binding protein
MKLGATIQRVDKCTLPKSCDTQESTDQARGTPLSFERLIEDTIRRVIREELAVALRSSCDLPPAASVPQSTYLTISDAAQIAALHDNTIRKWIKDGSLRTQKAGRVHRIKREDLEARLAGGAPRPHTSGKVDIDARAAAILSKL